MADWQLKKLLREMCKRWSIDYRTGEAINAEMPPASVAKEDLVTLMASVRSLATQLWGTDFEE